MSEGSETATSYAHQRGAAYNVSSALAGIQFVPGTQGGMSAAVAYIQYWSRKGTQQRVALGGQQGAAAGGATPPSQGLSQSLSEVVPLQVVSFGDQPPPPPEPIRPETQPPPPPPPEPILLEAPPQTVSRRVLTVPTNPLQQAARPRQPVSTTIQVPVTVPAKAGPIYSANPGGAVAPPSSNPFYTPAQSEYAPPANAAWQFLFNPEELQLSSGPDFNRAESWGVSDRANSGQPLSWRSNRNRKLSFGKIVLHGYTIGKRVDSLEEGLQKLFEARDGDGQDGPPVLEFVWGPRVFGPCVIQNIQVREKAWDRGVLVNAEVSFELEQVPEWTINDGFVDVLRPGRQPSINDERAPASSETGTEAGTEPGGVEDTREPPKDKPGGGGGGVDQSASYRACQKAYYFVGVFAGIEYYTSRVRRLSLFEDRPLDRLNNALNRFEKAYNQAAKSVGKPFTKRVPSRHTPSSTKETTTSIREDSNLNQRERISQALDYINTSARISKDAASNVWNKDCKEIIAEGKKAQLCKAVAENQPCTIGNGKWFQNPCTKKNHLCTNGKYGPGK